MEIPSAVSFTGIDDDEMNISTQLDTSKAAQNITMLEIGLMKDITCLGQVVTSFSLQSARIKINYQSLNHLPQTRDVTIILTEYYFL